MSKQQSLMHFCPAFGTEKPYPSHAGQYRAYHGTCRAWLFNPWTGERRQPDDIGSDINGHLIVAPGNVANVDASNTPGCGCPTKLIGAEMDGGINAGVMRSAQGGPASYSIILGPELQVGNVASHEAQLAELNRGEFKDWRFPTLEEQAVMRANLPKLFKPDWYLASDDAGLPGHAWCTSFLNGGQLISFKDLTCRGRPVRSSTI